MKKLFIQMLSVVIVTGILNIALKAQEGTVIKFPKGRSSTTISGKLGKGEEKSFSFSAKEGQKVVITVIAANKKVTVIGFGWGGDESISPSIDGLTDNGENSFSISNMGRSATTYTMKITVS